MGSTMITIACVRTGNRYPIHYVAHLRSMVSRNISWPHRFICLTDDPTPIEGVELVNIKWTGLTGWWGKMALFSPEIRGPGDCIYFDLDTVIVGSIDPLARLARTRIPAHPLYVCENFTKRSGHPTWPCRYGSCCMVLFDGTGRSIFNQFMDWQEEHDRWPNMAERGDQQVIEQLEPNAGYLQDMMPDGFFVGRREFDDTLPDGAAVMVFAGQRKPHNTDHPWVKEHWR